MRESPATRRILALTVAAALACVAVVAAPPAVRASAPTVTATSTPVTDLSSTCGGQNAEVEQAVDPALHYVYAEWMGCTGIAFARSTDGGLHFNEPLSVPGSIGSNYNVWDPAVAVAPSGTVYASFMRAKGDQWYPVVAASFDHGLTFPQVSSLIPPDPKNWGDRDFIAVGPDGSVYVTWDYGPDRSSITFVCSSGGSCGYSTGQLNVVVQKSTDGGNTWGAMVDVSPGFPASGGDSAPLVVEPGGRIDVLYQGYRITNTTTYALKPAHQYFTSSTDGGQTWSMPVLVGADQPSLTMSLSEWWIDGAIAVDAGGNLYATWDTQGATKDIGWLATSRDHGRTWSTMVRVTPDQDNAVHIVEVSGGPSGIAYVAWLTNANAAGYTQYVRAYSLSSGWLTPPISVSGTTHGDPSVWPGDTFGISTVGGDDVALTWGSGVSIKGQPQSEIFSSTVRFTLP